MATVQFPGGASFVIAEMLVTRSISRQGRGARATWRRFSLPESSEVLEWNGRRDQVRDWTPDYADPRPLHGIRASHRAWLPVD